MNDEFLNHVACIRLLIGTIVADVNLVADVPLQATRNQYRRLAQTGLRHLLEEVKALEEEHDSQLA